MAQAHPVTRLGSWSGYEVMEDWQQQGGRSCCVLRQQAVVCSWRSCSQCGELTQAVHDQEERRIRGLPIFEHRLELIVPRLLVACRSCGPKQESGGPGCAA